MINHELTPKIKEWLDTEPEKRDLRAGAEMLMRVTMNKILYQNLMRNLPRHAEAIEYHLKKIYTRRLADITHEQVAGMMRQVDSIAKARRLDLPPESSNKTELQRGKRADHDELPEEIQKLYFENAEISRKMRECHLHLRMISPDNSTCPDSDRYPWAKEIIALDSLYRENWNRYDHYVKGTPVASTVLETDARSDARAAARVIHLLLGKYNPEAPDEALAQRIRDTYARIPSPTGNVRAKMQAAGLL